MGLEFQGMSVEFRQDNKIGLPLEQKIKLDQKTQEIISQLERKKKQAVDREDFLEAKKI